MLQRLGLGSEGSCVKSIGGGRAIGGHCQSSGLEGGPGLGTGRQEGQHDKPSYEPTEWGVCSQEGTYCPLAADGATSVVKGSLPARMGCGFNVRAPA